MAAPPTPPYGGYDFALVSDVPEDCLCRICSKILRTPHLTECCGQDYCESCLKCWLQVCTDRTCPQCRYPAFRYIQDKKVERSVRELVVYCQYREKGCDWMGKLAMTDSHVMSENGCSFSTVECPNRCGKELIRKDLQVHVDTICQLRDVECEYCHQRRSYELMINGHHNQCLEIPMPCTNDCGKLVTRRTLQAHLENECSTQCPFHTAGCSAIVAYRDLETHTASCLNKYLPKAFLLLQKEMGSLKSQLQSIQEENKTQKSQLQMIREENETLKEDLSKTKNDLTDAQKKQERRTELISTTLSTEIDFMQSSHAHATQAEALALECLRTRLGSNGVHLKCNEAPATFRMSNYAEHKETDRVWHTPPFFIHSGYKMCLSVHVNGFGVGKGTHLSVCLHQLAGEYDSQLKWPFLLNEIMEVTLLQQQCEGSKQSVLSKALRSPESPANSPESLRKAKSKSLTRYYSCGEPMHVCTLVHRVTSSSLPIGPKVGSLEMFCLQAAVERVVYRDTLVFQCAVNVATELQV